MSHPNRKEGDRPRQARRLGEPQRFGIRFFLFLMLAALAAWAVQLPARLGALQQFLATTANALARLTGGQSQVFADQIHAGRYAIDINYECTGAYVFLILFTFLFAYPASWQARLLGAAIGAVALTAINVLRISVLVRVAELQPDLFAYFHEYVWQGVFLVLVIAYAMQWVQYVRPVTRTASTG